MAGLEKIEPPREVWIATDQGVKKMRVDRTETDAYGRLYRGQVFSANGNRWSAGRHRARPRKRERGARGVARVEQDRAQDRPICLEEPTMSIHQPERLDSEVWKAERERKAAREARRAERRAQAARGEALPLIPELWATYVKVGAVGLFGAAVALAMIVAWA